MYSVGLDVDKIVFTVKMFKDINGLFGSKITLD